MAFCSRLAEIIQLFDSPNCCFNGLGLVSAMFGQKINPVDLYLLNRYVSVNEHQNVLESSVSRFSGAERWMPPKEDPT